MRILSVLCLLCLMGCAGQTMPTQTTTPETLRMRPVSFDALPGWGADDLQGFSTAFEKSCTRIMKAPANKPFGALAEAGTYSAWQNICHDLKSFGATPTSAALQNFITAHFTPYELANGAGETGGLFTGYYESSLKGSRVKTPRYHVPLYARPADLVMVDLGEFRKDLKGQRIAGRVKDGALKPYETRAQIVSGAWPHHDKALVWVDNPVDAFFVQIQGSGIVALEDGSTMRIGYAGQNGHIYTAIGRELIARGELTKETVSMQTIRAWLQSHPAEAAPLMNVNESYVFFQEPKDKSHSEGPMGAENIPLTPERSIAIDRALLAYGLPLWVDIQEPHLQRLMVAQDTGGAIKGAVRGDVFWGYGQRAENIAGEMKSPGRAWVLLPKKL